jgi:hypothetical protein
LVEESLGNRGPINSNQVQSGEYQSSTRHSVRRRKRKKEKEKIEGIKERRTVVEKT